MYYSLLITILCNKEKPFSFMDPQSKAAHCIIAFGYCKCKCLPIKYVYTRMHLITQSCILTASLLF